MRVRYQMLIFLTIGITMILIATSYNEKRDLEIAASPVPFLKQDSDWIDSTMEQMSLYDKVGQLVLVKTRPSGAKERQIQKLNSWFSKYKLGGVIFDGFTLEDQYYLGNQYQAISEVPLIIGMYNNPMESRFVQFPDEWSMASIRKDSLILAFGKAIADQGRDLGIQLYLPPHKQQRALTLGRYLTVASKIQKNNILACAQLDINDMPEANATPFWDTYHSLAQSGTVSALFIKPEAIVKDTAMNLSQKAAIKQLLRSQIGFEGLLISEIYDTVDVTIHLSQLMHAGVDMVMVNDNADEAIETIVRLIKGNFLIEKEINAKVRRVLKAKSWTQANLKHTLVKEGKEGELRLESPVRLNHKLAQAAITLIKDDQKLIPFKDLSARRFHVLSVGSPIGDLLSQLEMYAGYTNQQIYLHPEDGILPADHGKISRANSLLAVLHNISLDTTAHQAFIAQLEKLAQERDLVVLNFGPIENLKYLSNLPTILQAYNGNRYTQSISSQVLFGGLSALGMLPVNINSQLKAGSGIMTQPNRLAYVPPEIMHIPSSYLMDIDSIVKEGISEFAMPGCQVLVAKKGKVIYHKSFGYHTYAQHQPVQKTDLYDLASITKVAATSIAGMKMYESGRLELNKMLGTYFTDNSVKIDSSMMREVKFKTDTLSLESYNDLYGMEISEEMGTLRGTGEIPRRMPERLQSVRFQDSMVIVYKPVVYTLSSTSNIFNVSILELMTHHSGLGRSLPINEFTYYRRRNKDPFGSYFDRIPYDNFVVQVAGDFYLNERFQDSLWKKTKYLQLNESRNYQYSDVNMILVQKAIDSLNQRPIDQYLDESFYKPLGLQTLGFNPRRKFLARKIVPTEYDLKWRKQLLRGYVHDPTAALMGGVAGSAGLFSNANDIAILFQMLLNEGEYAGEKFIDKKTVELFTDRHMGHRGLGFDKPPRRGKYTIASQAPETSYGHTGFTGTCVWADPENDLVYVFLSNRIHPTADNKKLSTLRIRERIHDVVYDAIHASEAEQGMADQLSLATYGR